jgi:DNA-binding LacI/PurR family transcriptional regulator
MFDVASHSGVSHQTVSRVLNNQPNVSEKTRTKVLIAINKLGYRPNLAARALATGKTATIGVLSHDTTLYGPASTLHAVQSAARDKKYKTSILSLKGQDQESILSGVQELISDGVDGVIIIAPQLQGSKEINDLIGRFPAVLVEGETSKTIPSVNIDQVSGAYEITKHLIDLGHKKIAHISGPTDWYEAQKRIKGWKLALSERKLEHKFLFEGDWSAQSGYTNAQIILKNPKITAIFAGNDTMALGVIKAISESTRKTPQDISVVGFDDVPESKYLTPSLTTVRQDFHAIGENALEVLLEIIGGQKLQKSLMIKPELILRESTATVNLA